MHDDDIQKLPSGWWVPKGVYGKRFFKHTASDGLPAHGLDVFREARKHCKHLRVAVDAGAYVGVWTRRMLRDFDTVYTFEPMPINYECLFRNTWELRTRCHLFNKGLSNTNGPLYVSKLPAKPFNVSFSLTPVGSQVLSYQSIRLDDLGLETCDLIKLDVEGMEHLAILGALGTIRSCRPVVVIEEKFDHLYRASALLEQEGMTLVAEFKHDRVFAWK